MYFIIILNLIYSPVSNPKIICKKVVEHRQKYCSVDKNLEIFGDYMNVVDLCEFFKKATERLE